MQATTAKSLLLLLSPFALLGSTQASKDGAYYRPGTGNPNINEKMYWKDAENVLQDLDQFSSLYVEFHHCAWTWMRSDEDADNDVDENDYWYMGSVPPFGANVAFSLYGALKGESFSGCSSSSFINSFYTNSGFTDFVYAMQNAGVSQFSSSDFSGYSSECGGGYGVGCDYDNGFGVHTYASTECNPANYSTTSDDMYDFNQAMESVQCVRIYNSGSSNSNNGYYNSSSFEGTPLELLSYSSACYYQNYWSPDGECPDPYGRISYYQKNYNKGVQVSKNTDPFEMYTKQMEESEELRHMGTMMMIAAGVVLIFGFLIPFCCKRATRRPKKVLSPPPTRPPLFDAPEIAVVQNHSAPSSPVGASFQQQKSVIASFDEQPQQQKSTIEDAASVDVFLDDAEIVQSRSYEEAPQEVQSKKRGFGRKLRGVFGRK